MKLFDDVIERVTQRFDLDPELHAELAMELRSHLEESARAFEAAGASPDDAAREAVAAMGDEQELSEQLWNANLRRLRLRSLMRWVGRLTLVPAAIVLVVFLLPPNLLRLYALQESISPNRGPARLANSTAEVDEVLLVGMAPLLLANGAEPGTVSAEHMLYERVAARYGPDSSEAELVKPLEFHPAEGFAPARRKQLLALRGHDLYPLLYAVHAQEVVAWHMQLDYSKRFAGQDHLPAPDPEAVLQLIAQGEAVDPDQALYNLLRAHMLLEQAWEYDNDQRRQLLINPLLFDQAMEQVMLAIEKGLGTDPKLTLVQAQLSLLPGAGSVEDILMARSIADQTWTNRMYSIAVIGNRLSHRTADLIEAGQLEEAARILELRSRLADESVAAARITSELIDAHATRIGVLRQHLAWHHAAGNEAAAARLAAQIEQSGALLEALGGRWHEIGRPDPAAMPLVAERASLAGQIPSDQLRSLRRAEHLMMDRAALSVLAGILLIVLLFRLLVVHIIRWTRPAAKLSLVHIPLHRLLRLLVVTLVLPLAIYALYAWSPLGLRGYGLAVASEPTVVEYTLLGCIILTLLRIVSWNEIARRTRQLGSDEWPMLPWRPAKLVPLGVATIGGAAAYLITWRVGGPSRFPEGFGYGICVLLIAVNLLWWAADRHWLRREMRLPSAAGGWYRLLLLMISLVLVALVGRPWAAVDVGSTVGVGALVIWLCLAGEFIIRFWHSVKLPPLRLYHHSTTPLIAAVLLTVTAVTGFMLRQAEAVAAGRVDTAMNILDELEQTPRGQAARKTLQQQHPVSTKSTTAPAS